MAQIRALAWKDLQVHWRAAALLLVGWPVGVRLLVLIVQASPGVGGPGLPIVVTMVSLLLFVAVAFGLATMLVERERSKDTFAWLRTLPVSDAHIVTGKCVAGLVFHSIGCAAWWMIVGPGARAALAPALTVPQAVSVWCVTAVIGSIPLAGQIASSGRLAPAAPVAVLALGLLAWPMLGRSPAAAARAIDAWRGSAAHPLIWTGCLAAYAVLMAVVYWRFHADDTDVLID